MQTLLQIGLEPLATLPMAGSAMFTFTVPAIPGIAGTTFGFQAVVLSQAGSFPIGSGWFADLTNALAVTPGY
jgi:hypothetical protein